MSSFKAGAAALLALAMGPLGDLPTFTRRVPTDIPAAFQDWERVSADIEIESPRTAIQYEFFVNPERPAIYEVIRYRILDLDVPEARRYATTEKLQWDRDGRDIRRYECVVAPGGGCTWRELAKGSAEYMNEVPVVIGLYGLHRKTLFERLQRPETRHLASPRRVILPLPAS